MANKDDNCKPRAVHSAVRKTPRGLYVVLIVAATVAAAAFIFGCTAPANADGSTVTTLFPGGPVLWHTPAPTADDPAPAPVSAGLLEGLMPFLPAPLRIPASGLLGLLPWLLTKRGRETLGGTVAGVAKTALDGTKAVLLTLPAAVVPAARTELVASLRGLGPAAVQALSGPLRALGVLDRKSWEEAYLALRMKGVLAGRIDPENGMLKKEAPTPLA